MAATSTNDFTDIIASSVHDMKNSVGMMLSSLEQIGESFNGAPTCQCSKEQVAMLQYEAKRVNRNLLQLLTLYRIDSGHYGPTIDEWDLMELLQEAYLLNKPLLGMYDIQLDIECADGLRLYCDRSLLLGLLDNVITNALRYSKSRMLVCAVEEGDYINIRVEDDGAGYPNNMLVDAENFVSTIDFQTGSTGIGLYFSNKIAAMHKNGERRGSIAIGNGGILGGAVFTVSLPL